MKLAEPITVHAQSEGICPLDAAVDRVVGASCPVIAKGDAILMLVEDPGAANFAAGLLPELARHGRVSIFASGEGASQLTRLGITAQSLPVLFDPAVFLQAHRPVLVVAGTSEQPGAVVHETIAACRRLGIPTLGFVDGPANIDRRFRGSGQSALEFAPDRMLVPSSSLRGQLQKLGYAGDSVLAVEHPHFAHVGRERARLEGIGRATLRARLFPGVDLDRRVVVFLAERSDGLVSAEFLRSAAYTLAGRGGDDRRTNIVLEEVLDALDVLRPRPYVVLRLHPKNEPEEFAGLAKEIDHVSRSEALAELVYAADLVVGLTTIALSEAAALGCPVLSIVPCELERDWLLDPPDTRIDCVSTRAALASAVRNYLQT